MLQRFGQQANRGWRCVGLGRPPEGQTSKPIKSRDFPGFAEDGNTKLDDKDHDIETGLRDW